MGKGAKSGKLYEIEDGKVKRTHHTCPKCGPGVFLANHYDRYACGKCGYTRLKKRGGGAARRRRVVKRKPRKPRAKRPT